ncbi:dTDP-4-dehydrorhamnose 3,5-epimerase [Mesonia ostreae]|uniref:dTDP-4-dehydrorhamnose 3,5-epimerase n=1 Tax=Mesonia ostreae TaxID=861110 RepID=A0ABU2KIW9_9FLAO|nr:dTDP-4-dehydrorhamnose 3,5-epimerase [Mesonia ostreae]MDT0294663.1 dTDP-4-dehydrorhamnose 3,5-epimerase [Mesonia ostreae]
MKILETPLRDCFIVEPSVFKDARGYFLESFNQQKFQEETGLVVNFVQDNQSVSQKGTLRGLHFQTGEAAQAKLVRVILGEIQDVMVDLRPDSETYLQKFSCVLNSENQLQLFVPKGFAHGFVCLTDEVIFSYKCDNYYDKAAEAGIIFNDPQLHIDWKLPQEQLIISEKDKGLPTLKEYLNG